MDVNEIEKMPENDLKQMKDLDNMFWQSSTKRDRYDDDDEDEEML